MSRKMDLIKIGEINYTNIWPILYHFPKKKFENQIQFVSGVPTKLNKALSEGELDMAPISSFAYAESFRNYVLFPDLSVSSFGKVNSILLFHKKPLEQIVNRKIALPTTSATSVNLLKIIIHKFYHGNPEYCYSTPQLDEMMKEAEGALLIGDDAIQAKWANSQYEVTDLGELWTNLTDSWMTFAVWAVRKDIADHNPKMVQHIFSLLKQSKEFGLNDKKEMIKEAQARIGGSESFWIKYFSELSHDFGQLQKNGLKLYYQFAREMNLIPEQVPIQMWTNQALSKL
ncbi:menaquinone biosynthetic enzyme MqnA/MqnD family protein [Chengkuizengella sediminis]|uniref:menaquinone biosynthetic enzyme MqnA/MqnD family protein n=1 Tax=Chengkuizengella sediminis TaxID=1885917 RepID=UPI0013894D45|nr:menaquinone biosynthesis protein [Chengkuizengella sediminis]NDI34353.1 menaquinone biosynthesis protein [Chengkuizengella sediminis]